MGKMILRKGDQVMILAGKDKGKSGKVLRVFREKDKAIVERINFHKSFVRADRSKNVQGGIMEKEAPLHVSNMMMICSDCGQPVRIKKKASPDGTLIRACAKCGTVLEKAK